MSQIEEPTVDAAEELDVEGHGLREVAAGLTVTAAVIGGAGAAAAASAPAQPSVGGTTGSAVVTADQTLRGTGLATGEALAKQVRGPGAQATATGYTVDAAAAGAQRSVSSVRSDVDGLRGDALQACSDLAALAGEIGDAALSDSRAMVAAANRVVEQTADALGAALGWLLGEVDRTAAEAVSDAQQVKDGAELMAHHTAQDARIAVEETRSAAERTADEVQQQAMSFVQQRVDEARDTAGASIREASRVLAETQAELARQVTAATLLADDTVRAADELAAGTVVTATTKAREAGAAGGQAAASAVTTATTVPGQTMGTVISTLQDTKEAWDEAASGLTSPDVEGAVDQVADRVEGAVDLNPR